VDGLALQPLGGERRRGDRRAAAEGLEPGVLDDAVVADLDLQAHDVAARGGADEAGADVLGVLVEGPDVLRVLVVLDDFLAVRHDVLSRASVSDRGASGVEAPRAASWGGAPRRGAGSARALR